VDLYVEYPDESIFFAITIEVGFKVRAASRGRLPSHYGFDGGLFSFERIGFTAAFTYLY
jgi:hypothetical protein